MFGFILKKIRETQNYSQEYMACQLNITQAAYSKIESGKTRISLNKLIEILKILGIKKWDILNEGLRKEVLSGASDVPTKNNESEDYINALKKTISVFEKDNEQLKSTNERLLSLIEQNKNSNN